MSPPRTVRRGSPLVFIGMVVFAWIGVRVLFLAGWSDDGARAQEFEHIAEGRGEDPRQPQVADEALVHETPAPAEADAPQGEQGSRAILVEGLDRPPPAHLETSIAPPPVAAAHNLLWMEASGAEGLAIPSATGDAPVQQSLPRDAAPHEGEF